MAVLFSATFVAAAALTFVSGNKLINRARIVRQDHILFINFNLRNFVLDTDPVTP
ncbi:hypothetical protein D3C86_1901610 [compost metagenome]